MSAPEPQHKPGWQHGPDCGCWRCKKAHRPSEAPFTWALICGAWTVLGVLAWALTDSAANTCRNALVGALDQGPCTSWTFVHDIAVFSVVAGTIGTGLAIFAMIYRGRRS